jgi:hypothetical protein
LYLFGGNSFLDAMMLFIGIGCPIQSGSGRSLCGSVGPDGRGWNDGNTAVQDG